jgi:hypothetical protein
MEATAKIRTAIDTTITISKIEITTISSRERDREKTKTSPSLWSSSLSHRSWTLLMNK